MIKFKDILEEAKYDYGCVMLYADFPKEILNLQLQIDTEDLYVADNNGGYGLEDEAHCTILYGLHETVSLKDVLRIMRKYKFTALKADGPTLFENPLFDVLKYDVNYPTRGGAFLHKAHEELASTLPNTQTYPDYHPHMTIAYLKPGLGNKYVELFRENNASSFIVTPKFGVFSEASGNKEQFDI